MVAGVLIGRWATPCSFLSHVLWCPRVPWQSHVYFFGFKSVVCMGLTVRSLKQCRDEEHYLGYKEWVPIHS